MKYLKLFEEIDTGYISSQEYIVCPYCFEKQTLHPWEICKWGIVNYNCEFCKKKFEVEKEEIYHSSKISNFPDYTEKRG
jgi:DNA-directed RNA polymerase subunit RPC12/RpoP